MKKISIKKILMYIWLIAISIFMFMWSYKTPLMDDDFSFSNYTLVGLLKRATDDYFNWNGRIFGDMFSMLILSKGVLLSSILSGILFGLLLFLIIKITKIEQNNKFLLLSILITAVIFLFVPGFNSVFIWRAGVGNYLTPSVISLLFILLFYNSYTYGYLSILFFILGIISGWCNENTSGAIILISFLLCIKEWIKNKKWYISQLMGLGGLIIGYAALMFSPGSKKRALISDPQYFDESIFKRFFDGLLRQVNFFYSDAWSLVFFIIVGSVIVLAYFFWKDKCEFFDGLIFIIGGFASIVVMELAPEGMDIGRPYLGSFLLLIIGTFLLIPKRIDIKSMPWFLITTYVILLLSFVNCVIGVQDSRYLNSQLNDRYDYIKKNKNKSHIKVKPIDIKKSKYTLSDSFFELTKDKNYFPNNVYEEYFNIKSITLK